MSVVVAFIGYSVQNVSQATQKIGLEILKTRKAKGLLVWLLATVGTGGSAIVILYAVSVGNVSLVGAMGGSGLVALTLFSRLVLKEDFGKREIAGIITILGAAVLIGAFARQSAPAPIRLTALFIMLAAISGLYLLVLFLVRKKTRLAGIVFGGFAGALGGFVAQFQKVSTSTIGAESSIIQGSSHIAKIATNPYTLIWVALSMSAMVVL